MHPALAALRERRGIVGLPDDVIRTARAAYYGLVSMTDTFVGEVMAELDSSGLSANTAFFYTSDHGDMAGEHELWGKSCFYDASVRVPLIGMWPGQFRENVNVWTPVSLLDLTATLLALANAEALPDMRGRSLVSLLEGRHDVEPDRPVLAEGIYDDADPPARMIVWNGWKLVHYDGYDTPLLFNMDDEPGELRDRGSDPAYASIRRELYTLAVEDWSAAQVRRTVRRNVERFRFLSRWVAAIHPPDPDHWAEPDNCNRFSPQDG